MVLNTVTVFKMLSSAFLGSQKHHGLFGKMLAAYLQENASKVFVFWPIVPRPKLVKTCCERLASGSCQWPLAASVAATMFQRKIVMSNSSHSFTFGRSDDPDPVFLRTLHLSTSSSPPHASAQRSPPPAQVSTDSVRSSSARSRSPTCRRPHRCTSSASSGSADATVSSVSGSEPSFHLDLTKSEYEPDDIHYEDFDTSDPDSTHRSASVGEEDELCSAANHLLFQGKNRKFIIIPPQTPALPSRYDIHTWTSPPPPLQEGSPSPQLGSAGLHAQRPAESASSRCPSPAELHAAPLRQHCSATTTQCIVTSPQPDQDEQPDPPTARAMVKKLFKNLRQENSDMIQKLIIMQRSAYFEDNIIIRDIVSKELEMERCFARGVIAEHLETKLDQIDTKTAIHLVDWFESLTERTQKRRKVALACLDHLMKSENDEQEEA